MVLSDEVHMTLTTRQVKVFSWLLGVWFVVSALAFYLLGRQHGRASATCAEELRQVEEVRAQLHECRDDIEEARVASVQAEAVKCKARLEEYKRIRCRLCEAGVVP